MSKIYTKTGDKGKTSLFDGTRVGKDDIRLETYGTFDELSSLLGIAQSFLTNKSTIYLLQSIQRDLLDMGSFLANPKRTPSKDFITYLSERVFFFEKTIDNLTTKLKPLRNFILFTGTSASGFLQLSRSVARRGERRLVSLSRKETVDLSFIRYCNRLSDLLFTLGRFVNRRKKEVTWSSFTLEEKAR